MQKILLTWLLALSCFVTLTAQAKEIRVYLNVDCESSRIKSRIEDAYRADLSKLGDVILVDKDSCNLAVLVTSNHPFLDGGLAISVVLIDTDNKLYFRALVTCDVLRIRDSVREDVQAINNIGISEYKKGAGTTVINVTEVNLDARSTRNEIDTNENHDRHCSSDASSNLLCGSAS